MKRRFYVKIELDLHAVSNKPAGSRVWLCPNGYLEATIKSLGYFFKTGALEPKFPVLCHDQFVMEGYFKSIGCYAELERILGNESIEIVLWQTGRRLAYFSGKLGQIMQPPVPPITCFHHVNVQILMEPSRNFPGIIAPKLEVSARAIVQDKEWTRKTSAKGLRDVAPATLIPCFPKQTYASSRSRHSHDFVPEHKSQKPVCHTRKDFKWHRSSFVPSRSLDFASRPTSAAQICRNCSEKSFNGSCHDREECSMRSRNGSCSRSSSYGSCSSSKTFSCQDTLFCRDDVASEIENASHSKECDICESYRSAFKDFRQFVQ